ncbi:MAG TPA: hypothetical protein VLK34_08740 [Nocardioidaceae bacterium]|nr:hypothetical protein [Nocardioidaceae bacterium]
MGFEPLFDALEDGEPLLGVVEEIGRSASAEGVALDDVLANVAVTYQVSGDIVDEPPFEVVRAVAGAWADSSLRFLHSVSCEDPLTGLASLAHMRTRMSEVYRETDRLGIVPTSSHALLVVQLHWPDTATTTFDRLLRLIDVAELLRSVYTGDEVVGQLTASRTAVLVRRDSTIGQSVSSLLGLLQEWEERTGVVTRLWIEGLPATQLAGEAMLDELAR